MTTTAQSPAVPARRLAILLATTLSFVTLLLAGFAVPADAASQVQPANCNKNYDNGVNSLVVRAPKIWSNNGTGQTVHYRSQLYKWNGSAWAWKDTGIWRQGTAYPNTAWQDSPRTWGLNAYGHGSYSIRIQVQYRSGGTWIQTQSTWLTTYYDMSYLYGSWSLDGASDWCDV
jgi:hypothetical protein